jgi:hypothetical protein
MKVTLDSTPDHLILKTPDGAVPARIWTGTTESGIVVHAYVTRLFATSVDDTERLEREIEAERPDPNAQEPTRREVLQTDQEEGRVVDAPPRP